MEMGLISPEGENLLDFLELRHVLSTFDRDLRDRLWWPQERPVPKRVARGPLGISLPSMPGPKTLCLLQGIFPTLGSNLLLLHWQVDSLSLSRLGSPILYSTLGQILEKAGAPHSSTLGWKIPWAEEPGGLQSMGSLVVGHD